MYKKKTVDRQLDRILACLKNDVEKYFNISLDSSSSYQKLADLIENKTTISIDEKTLRNLYKDSPENYPNEFTLNTISKSIDFDNWKHYKTFIENKIEESRFFNPFDFKYDVENMKINQEITVGWYPDNFIKLKYEGKSKFIVLDYSYNYNYNKNQLREIHGFGLEYKQVEKTGFPLYPNIRLKTFEEFITTEEQECLHLII